MSAADFVADFNLSNTETRYGLIGKSLHWGSVALLLAMVIVAEGLEGMVTSAERLDVIGRHSSIGLLLLTIMLTRLYRRRVNINPQRFYSLRGWHELVAVSLHRSSYFILIAQCVIGIAVMISGQETIRLYGLINTGPGIVVSAAVHPLEESIHIFLLLLIYSLFLIHIVAAIYHRLFGVIEE